MTDGLTNEDQNNIERVQKTVNHIILGHHYTSYHDALEILSLDCLKDRRLKTCSTFANKAVKHPKFSTWFVKSEEQFTSNDRKCKVFEKKPVYKPVKSRTDRFKKSPIPFLTNILNNEAEKQTNKK